MEQLIKMFTDKYGYAPIPDDSNPPEVIINRLKEYIFDTKLELVSNTGRSNLKE